MAVALSGCVVIVSTGTNQDESMGPVKLTISACADGSPSCSGESNWAPIYELIGSSELDAQVLLAVRLPAGSTPPENLLATLGGGGALSFSRSPSYEGELQALEPAPAGERWWGWISATGTYSQAGKQSFTVSILTTLPRPPGGGPLESPLHWRPVVGGRSVFSPSLLAGRPVRCGTTNEELYSGFSETGDPGATVVCISHPDPSATRGFLSASFTDFGIEGSSVQAAPGSTVTAALVARRTGPVDPATTFSLAATAGIPGGTVSLDRSSVSLGGDATQPVLATIGVPAGTPPGTYAVSLAATAPGKPGRSGAVTVTIPDAATAERLAIRRASLTHRRFRIRARTKRSGRRRAPLGTKLKVNLSAPARLSISVIRLGRRAKRLGTFKRRLGAGGSRIAIRRRIGKIVLKPGRYRLVLVATGGGQRSAPRRLAFRVVGG